MLLVPCPWCGARHENEFTYGGDGSETAPDIENSDVTEWQRFVFDRQNPAGSLMEFWHHSYGCGRWILLRRDTTTNEFLPCEGDHT